MLNRFGSAWGRILRQRARLCFRFRLGGPLGRTYRNAAQYKKEAVVPTDTTYTHLRENLAGILDEVINQQEVVIVRRKGARDVALIPATELARLIETAHPLRSPRNARRLLSALRRAESGKVQPTSVRELRREIVSDP
jgi:antitoxin YefM